MAIEVSDAAGARDSKPAAREHWQQVWADNYELLTERLLEATSAERGQWGYCTRCHGKVEAKFPDTRARTDAISKLHELAGLRPRPDDGAAVGAPPVTRRIVLPTGEQEGGQAGRQVDDLTPDSAQP